MRIGFIGLGLMGTPMVTNIAKKHRGKVFIANRTHEKAVRLAQELSEYGVEAVESNTELARLSDVIITMVTDTGDVRGIYEEILPLIEPGKLCIDMSTIDPAASVEIAKRVRDKGGRFADAPVVKSTAAAAAGKLGIYVGADQMTFFEILPILNYMGENIIRMGDNGSGLVMKICHNALVSQIQNGVNETLVLAQKNGIDTRDYVKAISYGGGQNLYLDNHAEALANEDYATAFSFSNASKDVHICLDLAERSGVFVPGEKNAAKVYELGLEKGYGDEDWGATIKVVRERTESEGE